MVSKEGGYTARRSQENTMSNMIDLSAMSPEGIDLLLLMDGDFSAEALRGMPSNALASIFDRMKTPAPIWFTAEVIDDWRKANGMEYDGPGDGFDYEGAILARQEAQS